MRALFLALFLGSLMACGGGSGGSGGGTPTPPPPPTGLTLTQGIDFDQVSLRWTPPTTAVEGFAVEDRVNSGAFTAETTLIPGNAIGADVTLSAAVPELVTLGCRMRSMKGGLYSTYTPEATLFRGLRPPSGLVVRTQTEDIQISWARGSLVADHLVLERAIWDGTLHVFGPYATVATLAGSAITFLDHPTDGPMISYGYRIRYTTNFNGTPIESLAMTGTADQWTSLAPPVALGTTVMGSGIRLDWTVQSRNLHGQVVERATGLGAGDGSFAAIAFLGPTATTYTDPIGPGPYTYRVSSTTSATGYGYAVSSPSQAQAVMPPPAGLWGLQTQVSTLPLGDGLALTTGGTWHVAASWCVGPPANPMGLTLWRPSGAIWEVRVCGPTIGQGRFVSPGVLLDSSGLPHALYLKDLGGTVIPGPQAVTHLWHDGSQWREEAIATRTFWNGNVRYPVEFTLDSAGKLYVLWKTNQVVNQISTPLLEYATNASGAWVVGSLPVALVSDLSRIMSLRLAVAPNRTLYAALAANTNTSQGPASGSLLLLRKPLGLAWHEELAFADSLYLWDEVPFVILPLDSERAGFLFQEPTTYPNPNLFRYAVRTASGWGTPQTLGECATGSGYKVPSAAVLADGSRLAALLPASAGTTLVTWDATNGWASSLIRPVDPFSLPWVGFDSQGTLHALVPAGSAGVNGLAPWIHLTSTH